MDKYKSVQFATIFMFGTLLVGCSSPYYQKFSALTSEFLHLHNGTGNVTATANPTAQSNQNNKNEANDNQKNNASNRDTAVNSNTDTNAKSTDQSTNIYQYNLNSNDPAIKVVTDPENIDVLVNKQNALPANYIPPDLVTPNIPFLYNDPQIHLMRKVAADALEQLVAGAKKDGIYIDGVSGYRAYATQKAIYDQNVATQGVELANKYSAKPGTSEHQTGLAIDVSDSTGKYAIEDAFANTPTAKWLAQHAFEYGFIIRYPKGKEAITGYSYEPWHIRYVGKSVAKVMDKHGWTLEEYIKNMETAQQETAQK